jgi:Family of unknown function (DUF6152)
MNLGAFRIAGMLATGVLAAALPRVAAAHHSFATFDNTKTVTLVGTVKTFEWTNPHTWIWLVVPDGKGAEQVWGLEGTAPGELTRHGWNRHSINPGDKITVDIHPLRDGRAGGSYSRVTFADGRSLSAGAPPPIGGASAPQQ